MIGSGTVGQQFPMSSPALQTMQGKCSGRFLGPLSCADVFISQELLSELASLATLPAKSEFGDAPTVMAGL